MEFQHQKFEHLFDLVLDILNGELIQLVDVGLIGHRGFHFRWLHAHVYVKALSIAEPSIVSGEGAAGIALSAFTRISLPAPSRWACSLR